MRHVALFLIFAVWLLSSGCASPTSRARHVTESGFLGADFTLLEPGDKTQAQQVYFTPGTDWASYHNILLEPVTVWRGTESREDGVSRNDARILADYFYGVIRAALEKQGFKLVDTPMPHTLRVAVAVTKPQEAHVGLDVASAVVPQLHVLSSLGKAVTGKPAFVGEAQVEVKVTDATTGELIAAGIDHRVGGNVLNAAAFSSWGQVEEMMRLWASHGSYNLCRRQNRSDCIPPPPPS